MTDEPKLSKIHPAPTKTRKAGFLQSLKSKLFSSISPEAEGYLLTIAEALDKIAQQLDRLGENGNLQAHASGEVIEDTETIRDLAQAIREQKSQAQDLLGKLQELPELITRVQDSIDQQAKLGQRSESALEDFRETLREINAAMTALSRNQLEAYRDAAMAFDRQNQKGLQTLEESQRESVRGLRRIQEDQFRKLDLVLETTRGSQRFTLLVLFLFLISICLAIFVQLRLFSALQKSAPGQENTIQQPAEEQPK